MADFSGQLEQDIQRLRSISEDTDDRRLVALLAAVSDDTARESLLAHANDGHEYAGALITAHGESMNVIFSFRRRQGSFGILPLSILVTVDMQQRRAVRVIENFLAPEQPDSPPLGRLQPDLDIETAALERFDDDELVTEDEAEADAKPPPKVAPPPKKSTWI